MHETARWVCLSMLLGCVACGSDDGGNSGDPTSWKRLGEVTLILQTLDPASPQEVTASVAAAFVKDYSARCPGRRIGDCRIADCRSGDMPMFVHVDGVRVAGPSAEMNLVESSDTYSYSQGVSWQGGEPLTLDVQGSADFPSVHGSLETPWPAKLDPKPADLTADPRADLTVSWSSPQRGSIQISVATSDENLPVVWCNLPAASGTGRIPAKALSQLAWPATYSVYSHGYAEIETKVGDSTTYFSAFNAVSLE